MTLGSHSSPPGGGSCPWAPSAASGMYSGGVATVTVSYPWTLGFLGLDITSGMMTTTVSESVA